MAERIRPSDEVVQANIKKWGIPQPEREYTVLIHCTTYNHGKYIKNALEGFVMQKCSYSFCAIIIDDCSTDNNAEIIREYAEKYPDIIKPILLGENHMQRGILRDPYFEKWHKCAKYLAQCEGDDYWVDPYKLQKQVDFLESHPDHNLVHSYYRTVDENNNIFVDPDSIYGKMRTKIRNGYVWGYYLRYTGFILTCTTCIRMPFNRGEKNFFDLGSYMSIARISKVYCFEEEMAAYRRNPKGAMMSARPGYYEQLTVRVWLYQLYYYYINGVNDFYKNDTETRINRAFATMHILQSYLRNKIATEDKLIFCYVIRKEIPNLLYQLPSIIKLKLLRKRNVK